MSNKSWKEKFNFIAPIGIEHEVQGKKLTFYPISVKMLFVLKEIAKPLATAIAALFPDVRKDVGAKYEYANDPNIKPGEERLIKMETEGISSDLATLRENQQSKAISEIINVFTDQNNALVIGRLIVDSLQDEFERETMKSQDISEFVESLPITALKDMLIGLTKANSKVLGPLGERVSQLLTLSEKQAQVLKKKEQTTGETSETPWLGS